jgi:hypothetical protein
MSIKVIHPGKLSLFASLSIVDFFLTYQLVKGNGGRVYEGNPIADAWLSDYGWPGLLFFKMVAVLLVGGVCVYISLHRPRLGGHILLFACFAVAVVVAYSCSLTGIVDGLHRQGGGMAATMSQINRQEYKALRAQLMRDVADQRCTLAEAVAELLNSEVAPTRDRLEARVKHDYCDCGFEEGFAAHCINRTLQDLDSSNDTEQIEAVLKDHFEATYHRPLPVAMPRSMLMQGLGIGDGQ